MKENGAESMVDECTNSTCPLQMEMSALQSKDKKLNRSEDSELLLKWKRSCRIVCC